MYEMRVAAVVVVMVVVMTDLTLSYPTHTTPTTPLPAQQVAATVEVNDSDSISNDMRQRWALLETVQRMDDYLMRRNDYNEIMLESGEEEDQLSRLLFKLQASERVRESMYDPYHPRPSNKTPHGHQKQKLPKQHGHYYNKPRQPPHYLPNSLQQGPAYYTF
ncbi:hypothetical protein Pmani_028916 [Petrolisthes manimaculis]|uniref:Uncharacterized protein n=1 Tax=Petrolisthes manimaculis TaxID=1843537 RepID=A0AAE1P148_9EUCA|nr:hypothetical protein Pmani_028916 [Petrolisthes manimaculis]